MSREQLTRLARPVPDKYVKQPPKGKFGSYVGHDTITQILLAVVGPFDFKVEQIIYGPEGLVEGCTASMTLTIDGWPVTVTEVGDCEQPTNWKTQGARMKDAASDALKRCAMRFGCGLHLWAAPDYFLYAQLSAKSSDPADAPARVAGSEPAQVNA
jgi:hypothetical protein